jgi:Fe-S oxidoreductase
MNTVLNGRIFAWVGEKYIGLSSKRTFPNFARRSLQGQAKAILARQTRSGDPVLFLSDAFSEYFYPQAGLAAVQALQACGCRVTFLPVLGAGRTLISKGFLQAAQSHARHVVDAIKKIDPEGQLPVVGVEPSEIFTLRDEFPDLIPGDPYVANLAKRAYMIDEFLIRPASGDSSGNPRLNLWKEQANNRDTEPNQKVLLHGHCYQKAQPPSEDGYPTGLHATISMLKQAGYQVEVIESSCCGMAGAFGYETEHYDLSIQVGELNLLPTIRKADKNTQIAASGVSCQAQIQDGTGRNPVHPITLIKVK